MTVDVDGGAGSHLGLENVRPGLDREQWGSTGPATTTIRFPRASVAGVVRVPQFGNLRRKPNPLCLSQLGTRLASGGSR